MSDRKPVKKTGNKAGKAASTRTAVTRTGISVRVRGDDAQPVRTDHRSKRTVEEIVAATFKVLTERGSSKLSVRAVCDEAGIARGTLYRYFASKKELIEAATTHLRRQTDEEVAKAVSGLTDPQDILRAFLAYSVRNVPTGESAQLLQSEPELLVQYYRDSFSYSKQRVTGALKTLFEAWEASLGAPIDRDLVAELFVRFALSQTLVPFEGSPDDLHRRFASIIRQIRQAPAEG
jgi:AcrR family transcriptional regulator